MIRLFDYALSGNCYKVRLLLKFLGIDYEAVPVDFYPGLEHRSASFLRINPLGQLPVLEVDGAYLRDAQAILVYLGATQDATGKWYPVAEPALLGSIQAWLSFGDSLSSTLGALRLKAAMFMPADEEVLNKRSIVLLRTLDKHLWYQERQNGRWLCDADHPTIADIACFPYVALSEEAGVSLEEYPAVVRWCERISTIAGFEPMAGMLALPLLAEVAG